MIHKYQKTDPNTWSRYSMRNFIKQNLPGSLRITTDNTTEIEALVALSGITDLRTLRSFRYQYKQMIKKGTISVKRNVSYMDNEPEIQIGFTD